MTNLDKAKEAIKEVFHDTSQSATDIISDLEELSADIDTYVEALQSDLRREGE